jgi:hypothetical protein
MKHTTLASVLLVVLLLSACSSKVTPGAGSRLEAQAGAWEQIGFFNDSSPNGSTTVTTDGTNIFTAYPTFNAGSGCNDIRVKQWSGSNWSNVGSDLNGSSEAGAFQNCNAYYPSLVLNNSGNPVIAWLEEAGSAINVYVQRFNGTSWENLTPLGFAANNNQFYPSLVLDSSGNPIVAWRKDNGIYVERFDGTSWVNLVSDLRTPDGFANNPSLAVDPSDNPVLAWDSINNFGNVTNIYVQRYNGSSWEDVGAPLSWSYPNGGWSRPSLAVDSTGNPTIAWDSYDGSVLNIYVRRFDASTNTWVNVGSGILSVSSAARSNAQAPSLILDSSGNPIVAWQEFLGGGNSWNIYVHRFTGSAWLNVGSTPDTPVDPSLATAYGSPSLAISSAGNLAVAYIGGDLVHVSQYVTTLPGIAINVSPEPNAAGWNNSDVTVSFSSPDLSATCTPSVTVSEETLASGQVVSGTCTDSAGDSSSNSVTIKLDKTAPTVEVTGVTEGGTYTTNPTVTCSSSDALSGIATEAEPTINDNGGGSFTATCTNTDRAGNSTTSLSVTYTVNTTPVDTTPPVITPNVAGTLGTNGWHTSQVTVSWTVTDAESAITSPPCDSSNVTTDTAEVTFTCTATSAGGSSTQSVTVKRDATPPTATATVSPAANGNGWNNSDVTVSFTGTDATSGIASCDPDVMFTTEAVNQSASGICTDNAGNSSTAATATISLDKTAPTVTVTGVSEGSSYVLGSVPSADCDTTDALSGVATNATPSVTGGNPDGTGTFTAACSGGVDNSGNTAASVSVTYTVTPPASDTTPPVITPNITGTLGTNGWYRSNVSLTWSVTDPESAISSQTGCTPSSVTRDTTGVTFTCSATSAGGTTTNSITIKLDKTKPTISYVGASPTPNANGWYNTDVTVSFTGTDATSGLAACPEVVISLEGARRTARGRCVDNAGNVRKLTSPEFKIDKTAPRMRVTGVAAGRSYRLGSVPVAGCTSSDSVSGVVVQAVVSVTDSSGATSPNPPTSPGSYTATCSGAKDNADNLATPVSVTFMVR